MFTKSVSLEVRNGEEKCGCLSKGMQTDCVAREAGGTSREGKTVPLVDSGGVGVEGVLEEGFGLLDWGGYAEVA